MKKYFISGFLAAIILILNVPQGYCAFGKKKDDVQQVKKCDKNSSVLVSAYSDNPPFSWVENKDVKGQNINFLEGVGYKATEAILNRVGFKDIKTVINNDFEKSFDDLKIGNLFALFGIKFQSTLNTQSYYTVFPSIVKNPITVMVRSDKENDITSFSHLKDKNMKGVIGLFDNYSDFFLNKVKAEHNLEVVKTPFELFDKIISGKADYAFISAISGLAYSYQFGITHRVSFSKKVFWNEQLFLGITKRNLCSDLAAPDGDLVKVVKRLKEEGEFDKMLQDALETWRLKYEGVKPTMFSEPASDFISSENQTQNINEKTKEINQEDVQKPQVPKT